MCSPGFAPPRSTVSHRVPSRPTASPFSRNSALYPPITKGVCKGTLGHSVRHSDASGARVFGHPKLLRKTTYTRCCGGGARAHTRDDRRHAPVAVPAALRQQQLLRARQKPAASSVHSREARSEARLPVVCHSGLFWSPTSLTPRCRDRQLRFRDTHESGAHRRVRGRGWHQDVAACHEQRSPLDCAAGARVPRAAGQSQWCDAPSPSSPTLNAHAHPLLPSVLHQSTSQAFAPATPSSSTKALLRPHERLRCGPRVHVCLH